MRTAALLIVCAMGTTVDAQVIYIIDGPPLPKLETAKEYVGRGEARLAAGQSWNQNGDNKFPLGGGWKHGIPIDDFDAALELDPKCARAFTGRGYCQLERRQYDNAIKDFDAALALSPNDSRALMGRGHALIKKPKRECDKALRDYDRAIQLDPKLADAYTGRGWIYTCSDKHYDAAKGLGEYLRACEVDEFKDWWHIQRLVLTCVHLEKYAEAAKWQREIEMNFKRRGLPLPFELSSKAETYEQLAKERSGN